MILYITDFLHVLLFKGNRSELASLLLRRNSRQLRLLADECCFPIG